MTPDATTTSLYRFYNAADELLYVGITDRGARRWNEHRKTQPWWPDVTHTTVEHHPDRAKALEAERAAITTEHPRHNVVHNGDKVDRPPPDPTIKECRRSIVQVDDVVAADVVGHACPPVGIVTHVDDIGFRLALYSWLSLTFGHREILIHWNDVKAMEWSPDSQVEGSTVIYDMDPLAAFQERYR